MRKKTSRFISVFMAVILVFSLVPSALASTGVDYKQKPDFWQWIAGKGSILHNLVGYTVGAVCPHSEDGYHHASNYDRLDTFFGGETGYYDCTCDYCGATFKAYESDLQQSYDAQVAELPAQIYNSDGSLTLVGELDYMYFANTSGSPNLYMGCPHYVYGDYKVGSFLEPTFDCMKGTAQALPNIGSASFRVSSFCARYSFVYPIDGFYTLLFGCSSSYSYLMSGTTERVIKNTQWSASDPVRRTAGLTGNLEVHLSRLYDIGYLTYFSVQLFPPVFKVTPLDTFLGEVNTTYNIQSRPTSIIGDYAIIGDNGQIIKVDGDYIVNETTNTYHNPATGTTTPIVDWSYDYGDRAYTLSLEGGLGVTVKYGDENITIDESTVNDSGDTVTNNYTIYYLVDGSDTEDPDPSPSPSDPSACAHTWTETSRTEPTCTTAGKVTSTCSKCNQTKTETIPATGHTWVVERTVQTSYDEEGNLLQQGYTIYKCSVCGEEYKDMEGTGPPGEEEKKSIWEKLGDLIGSIFGGIGELIEAVFGKLLDALQSLADMLMGKLKSVIETVLSIFDEVPALFGGFLDFLGAIFPYLPPEITMLLTFGVVAVVFIGILKAVRR